MECKRERNETMCTCSFSCTRKGLCCECVKHHREKGQLPGCYFSEEMEKTGDRSIEAFFRDWQAR
ncbi:DUF6485 family protein [Christensenella massiliensis]|uniref:DUF6485 family protein n=1 Tax=Christensenella massiliensis TaxID=1805714 RepID=A0AAU8ABT9_9FIRM